MSKSEALKLITDPIRLLQLLYSKYGDVEEDFSMFLVNQFLYNKKTHINAKFKEFQYNDYIDEFLKRFYNINESRPRIPKLSNYYKNYHLFFCKPVFREWRINTIMTKFGDNKAEVFYKNNYAGETSLKEREKKSLSSGSSSEASNFTQNKTIFDKKTRIFIDNTVKNIPTITLNEESKLNSSNNLITKRASKNDSFNDLIKGLLPTNNNLSNSSNNINNSKVKKMKSFRMKSSLCTLAKRNTQNTLSHNSTNKLLPSPKLKKFLTNFKTNMEKFKESKPVKDDNNIKLKHKKNKTYYCSSVNNFLIGNPNNKNQTKKTSCTSFNNVGINPLSPLTCKSLANGSKINLIKSPKSSSVISYLNMILNLKNSKIKKNNCARTLNHNHKSSIIQSQRSTSNTSGVNGGGFNSENCFNSRNKKNLQSNTNSVRSFSNHRPFPNGKTIYTNSVDEKQNNSKNFHIIKNATYQISQKLTSKIEELIKKSNFKRANNGNKINGKIRSNIQVNPFSKYKPEDKGKKTLRVVSGTKSNKKV